MSDDGRAEQLESLSGLDAVPRVLDRKGCPLSYWLHGPVSGPLVNLTHGGGVDHRVWQRQAPFLVEHGYPVLVWDLRGHGRSRPMGTPFSVPEAADDLLAILDRIGNRTAFHVGLSVGGFVAQWLARTRPERVRAIAAGETALATAQPACDDELLAAQLAKLDRKLAATVEERRRLVDLYQTGLIELLELQRRAKDVDARRAPSRRRARQSRRPAR